MIPDNNLTTPEQRFFFPSGAEAECHESFDLLSQPQARILEGEVGYIVMDNPEGEEVAAQGSTTSNLQPGSRVKRVITLGVDGDESTFPGKFWLHPDGSDGTDDQKWLDSPIDTYELQEGDLLVLEVDRKDHMPRDAKIRDEIDGNGVLLWPADKKLPYSSGEEQGEDSDRDVSYGLQGVITSDCEFIGWKSFDRRSARYLIDLVVANAQMQNELERALLADSLPRQYSLKGMLSTSRAVMSYLQYFEQQRGGSYLSFEDPQNRYGEFPAMTDEQRSRYDIAFYALHAPRGQETA